MHLFQAHGRDRQISAIVELASHEFQSAPRDAVGLAVRRCDRAVTLQLPEKQHGKRWHLPAIAIVEFEGCYSPTSIFERQNMAALRECMEHPLFVSGNVHWEW
jgi:hypothetical protein